MAGSGGTHILSRSLFSSSLISLSFSRISLRKSQRLHLCPKRTLCFSTAATTTATSTATDESIRHSILLDRLRSRHLKGAANPPNVKAKPSHPPNRHPASTSVVSVPATVEEVKKGERMKEGFMELGLSEEVMGAVKELGIEVPTEIQCIGIPAVLEGRSVVLGSHTGSGKTLAYMLPLVQLLRCDEELHGKTMKPKRPRAVVLCPTRELSEQVFHVAKSISHHARFRSTRISGGGRLRPQEDALNVPVDMVVGTPGRLLQHIEDGNMVYGDIKYLVLDEADTMFDRGFGPDIRKFLGPLKKRAEKPGDEGFQTVLVTATMTKAVQRLVDEEFQGITHLRTSTLHKKIASARHDFITLSGSEDKMESLLQVLEPSLAKGNRVMVFCNTLNSSRAVDHCLSENNIFTVNYHGEVPAAERVENLKKFKSEEGDCPTLVCTDLAARGLDLDVDHVIMFDFPSNAIDYLHRTGRTARMGAKGKVTSLIAKKDIPLATRIEEAIKKNESLESLNASSIRQEATKSRQINQKTRDSAVTHSKTQKMSRSSKTVGKPTKASAHKIVANKFKRSAPGKAGKAVALSKPKKSFTGDISRDSSKVRIVANKLKRSAPGKAGKAGKAVTLSKPKKSFTGDLSRDSSSKGRKHNGARTSSSKLKVVGFRGQSSSGKKETLRST